MLFEGDLLVISSLSEFLKIFFLFWRCLYREIDVLSLLAKGFPK